MSQRPEYASPTTVAAIAENSDEHLLRKVRTCGKVLSYDRENARMLLWSGEHALLVDAKLCVLASGAWLKESYTTVIVIGYVERLNKQQFEEAERTMPAPSALPGGNLAVAEAVQIQALLIKSDPHVDLREWEEDCEQLPGYLQRLQDARSKRAATNG
ncbi:hypothetical protein PENSPDRAFT_691462 [Peniophora sp. CONT]|nr:hypothetical protein PENSPDRAFT_691462 [Peniophora sp. CONT]